MAIRSPTARHPERCPIQDCAERAAKPVVVRDDKKVEIIEDALKMLTASYMTKGIDDHLRILPRVAGAAVIIDDKNERIFSARIRPRSTWHGGEAPIAIKEKKKLF